MNDDAGTSTSDFTLLDRPEILQFIFYPRRDLSAQPRVANASSHLIPVDEGIFISCRFYSAHEKAPSILFFHGNGEIASDYDQIAPLFVQIGINLFVADYRGYGSSGGTPTFSAMMKDAHPVFDGFKRILRQNEYSGNLFMMGRSLGAAPAIELAFNYQDQMGGLIIESGFASVGRLVDLIGVPVETLGFNQRKLSFNVERIRSVIIPTLIIHGEYDNLIPLQHGRDLYQSSGAKDKRLLVIPGATHNDIFLVGMDDYLKTMKEFVATYS